MSKRLEISEVRIIKLYNEGYTYDEMCDLLGIRLGLLRSRIKELKLASRRPAVQVDEKEFEEAYLNEKLSNPQLAKKFGIGKSRVAKLVRDLKLREKEISLYWSMPIEA